MTQALQQSTTTLPPEELLCTLVGWVQSQDGLYGREALKAHFYRYARDAFGLSAKTFDYAKRHNNYSTISTDRVDNALNRITEAGAGMIRALEHDNHWQPGMRVRVAGYSEDEYTPFIRPGRYDGMACQCVDYQKQSTVAGRRVMAFCPHLIICFYLALAYKELKIASTRHLHLEER